MAEVLVYTAVFGGYDQVQIPQVPGNYRIFTDGNAPDPWQRYPEPVPPEGQRRARYWKTVGMPDDYPFTLWIDGNVTLREDPELIIEKWLLDPGADIALFKHPIRDCIYQEALICKTKRKDHPDWIDNQMARYRAMGFPEHFGLAETPIIARRRSGRMRWFNYKWHQQIEHGSVRDQLSFDFVRWATEPNQIRFNLIDGGSGWKKRKHPWFQFIGHQQTKRR